MRSCSILYVAGHEEFVEIASTGFAVTAQTLAVLLSSVLLLVGNVLLGVAVWRSGTLPRVLPPTWAVGAVLMLLLGLVIALLITGSTPQTVLVGRCC